MIPTDGEDEGEEEDKADRKLGFVEAVSDYNRMKTSLTTSTVAELSTRPTTQIWVLLDKCYS
ncbi:hypothetical protein PR003_g2756 [Phytophthora rubi]|uniref:Uncharacterized protein n=1 Tax=Phytophthora rubi TaxID=129364 RepID=A0A6A4FRV0_9STRA|nr:hypothetical protein PR003_g2756 [Phytophthora rubi]